MNRKNFLKTSSLALIASLGLYSCKKYTLDSFDDNMMVSATLYSVAKVNGAVLLRRAEILGEIDGEKLIGLYEPINIEGTNLVIEGMPNTVLCSLDGKVKPYFNLENCHPPYTIKNFHFLHGSYKDYNDPMYKLKLYE